MKLYYSGNSPYARRARVAVREAGLLNQVEEINLGDRPDRMDVLLANGPGAKVPVLATADGVAIWESLIICKYLDEVSGGKLYPADRAERQTTLQLEAMGSVLMDALFVRSREKRRDPPVAKVRRAKGHWVPSVQIMSRPAPGHFVYKSQCFLWPDIDNSASQNITVRVYTER